MKKRPIGTRWTVSVITLALLPLVILGFLVSWKSYTVQIELTNKYQREVARHALSHVQVFIHEIEAIFQMAIKINNLNYLSRNEQAGVLEKLLNIGDAQHINLIEELSIVDRIGREEIRISRMKVYTASEMRELSNSEVFLYPFNKGDIYYGPVRIIEETGEPFFSMGIPTFDLRSGEIDGVLVAKVRLHAAWEMLTDISVGEQGDAFIVDTIGRIVAHKNRSLVLKGISIGEGVKECHIEKGITGGLVLRTCEPFNLGGQKLWLVTDTPLSEALAPTFGMIQTIAFLLFLSLAAAGFLGFIVRRRVIRPIESLAKTAAAITDGDLDRRAEVLQDDELGALADAFNTMAARLIETIDSLLSEIRERKKIEDQLRDHRNSLAISVEEATKDLSKSNKQLQEEIKVRVKVEEELNNYKDHLEELVRERTSELLDANIKLQDEISERKRAREMAAVMEERSRLARELHDSVSQSLYSLTLFAETGRQLVEKGDLENLRLCFSEIVSSSQVILKEMRLLMFDLRPAALEEEGLLRALQKRLDSVEQRSGVKAVLNVNGDAKLSPALEEGIYRIAQEALNNSLKYSSADNVSIDLCFEPDKVEMQVSDDGLGFDVDSVLQSGGMGLSNMQERAAKLGGTLQVSSDQGEGTCIIFSFKYKPENK